MKTQAWQFSELGTPDNLTLVEHDLPEPGPGEALVRIKAVGLNNSDSRWIAGTYIMPPPSPSFVGQEAVGEIIKLGPPKDDAVSPAGYHFEVGARVALMYGRMDIGKMGAFRREGVYSVKALLPVPEHYSDAEGAAYWIAASTVWGGFQAGGLTSETSADKTALITAASSSVGTLALQVAQAWGARTIGTTRSIDKAEQLADLADHVVVAPEPTGLIDAMKGIAGGKGADLIFDPVGEVYTEAFYQLAKAYGNIVFYERISGTFPTLDLKALIGKEISIHGFTIYRFIRNPDLLDTMIGEMMALSTRVKPVIDSTFDFDHTPDAITYLTQSNHVGKVVVNVG